MPRLLLLLAAVLALASGAHAQTCSTSWENPVDGDWDDATKWTAGVPTGSTSPGGVDPCITVPGTYTVTIRPDYGVNISLATLTLGGASGTQTLVSGGSLILTDMTISENAVAEFVPGASSRAFSGLTASGTVLVEGLMTANYTGVRGFLQGGGTLEVASGGILRGSNGVRFGDGSTAAYRIRGTAELSDGAGINARTEVLGGTVRALSGQGSFSGGILRDATLDAASGATLVASGSLALEGTLSGAPEGEVYVYRSTLTAEASGVTLDVTGTGLRFGRSAIAQFPTILAGGPVLNTGRFVFAASNFFSSIRGTTLTNEGALDLEGDMQLAEGAVVRNRPGGVLRMVGTQISQNPNTSVVRLENAGLIVREDVGPNEVFSRFVNVTLESLPGSEIRVLDEYMDFAGQDLALPPGMMLTGSGTLRMAGLPIRSTFSPGTEADPIGTLGSRDLDTFVLAPEAITVLDVAAGGVGDMLINNTNRGASMTLGGTLRVRVQPEYTPSIGEAWTIAVNGGGLIQGAFSAVETESVPSGVSFAVDTSQPSTAVLRAVATVSVQAPLASAQEGTPLSFVLTHPASPGAFSINVETSGTATLFSDYTISATRGVVRARANTTQTTVQVFARRDANAAEGDETITLRVVQGLDATPGATPEASVTIQDGPSNTALAVDGIAPAEGSNVGIVTATIYGSALTENASVRLVGPGTVIGERVAAFGQNGGLRATFDLRGAPAGTYDVEVTDNGTATLAGAFRVTADAAEVSIWGAINGTPAPRFGRYSTYTVTIGNDGSTDVFDTLVNLRITGGLEYEILGVSKKLGSDDEPLGAELADQTLVPLYLYRLPAKSHVEVSVRVRPQTSGEPIGVLYQLHRPNPNAAFTTSGDFGDLSVDTAAGEPTYWALIGGYMHLRLRSLTATTRTATPPVRFAWMRSADDGDICPAPPPSIDAVDNAAMLAELNEDDPVYAIGAKAFADVDLDQASSVVTADASALQMLNQLNQMQQQQMATAAQINQIRQETAAKVAEMYRENGLNKAHTPGDYATWCVWDADDVVDSSPARSNRLTRSNTSSGDLLAATCGCSGGIVGASGDPNDKLGPFGVLAERYTRPDRSAVPYTIRFENMPTASFPAQEVIVVDTLDTAAFDLSTFALGPITWGETGRLTPPSGAQSFEAEVDLMPELAATLLVTAALDPASGRVAWHFVTLDPNTGDLPENGTVGFLPPNTNSPNGEGALQFTVKTREGLTTGTEVSNSAEIIFDVNEPIRTPVWTNTVDTTPPVSSVQPLAGTETNPVTLTLSGSDAGSGIQATIVFASQDGGAFEAVGASQDGTFEFEGESGSTYGFYSIAVDAVANVEGAKTSAEATTVVVVDGENGPDLPLTLTLETPRPNPVSERVRLRYGVPRAGEASVRVLDALGREVATLVSGEAVAGWHMAEWQPAVASGVYVIELRSGDAIQHQRLTVVR